MNKSNIFFMNATKFRLVPLLYTYALVGGKAVESPTETYTRAALLERPRVAAEMTGRASRPRVLKGRWPVDCQNRSNTVVPERAHGQATADGSNAFTENQYVTIHIIYFRF